MNLILFDQDEINSDGNLIELRKTDPRARHLHDILKAGRGYVFDAGIINGTGGKALITDETVSSYIIGFSPEGDAQGLHPVYLLLGLSRPPTIKKVLKEATALGVKKFILCGTENGERSYRQSSTLKPDKIREVLIEGAQQAVCTMLPEVCIEHSLRCAIDRLKEDKHEFRLLALDNYQAEASLTDYWKRVAQTEDCTKAIGTTVLAVGSERGWTDRERQKLRDTGFVLLSLGPRVLRTETASIAGLAVCLSGMGLI